MTTITEDYVSFETAKLLKEKGFNEYCPLWYNLDKPIEGPFFYKEIGWYGHNSYDYNGKKIVSAPTLQMAMKWLREEHSIIIIVEPHIFNALERRATQFSFSVWAEDNYEDPYFDDPEHQLESFPTYEKACDVAIKYCLTNLV